METPIVPVVERERERERVHKTTGLALGILLVSVFAFLITYHLSRITPPAVQATVGDVTIDQSVGGTSAFGNVTFQKLTDTANAAYFLDPAATGNSLVTAGDATVSGNIALGNAKTIRSAFGPLSLQYKSGLDAWTTGLTLQDTTGNIGIGTATPGTKLEVAGTIKSTSGGFTFPDGTTQTAAASALPAGLVSFFNLAACPSGWTELVAARGMYIVGLPLSGTLAGTAGTALTNLENRAVGQHNHGITDPGHSHSFSVDNDNCCSSYVGFGQGDTAGGSRSVNSNTTGITINNAGTVAGTNAPYIQLLACQKD